MFDLNAIVNAAITEAVNARITEVLAQHANIVGGLAERITALESVCATQHEGMVAMRDRIAALETNETYLTNRIAALENNPAQGVDPAITIDEARMVEALNSQEWFWEKLHNTINDNVISRVEEAIDAHCADYDHDDYDAHCSDDDKHFDGDIEDAVRDALSNMTFDVTVS